MRDTLGKCTPEDLEYISEVLDNYVSFTNDTKRKELLAAYKNSKQPKAKRDLICLIDKQIRYFGASDVAYLFRSIFNEDGGVSAREVITDVCEKLKLPSKVIGPVESLLERLVKSVVEKELVNKKPHELRQALGNFGVDEEKIKKITQYIKINGTVAMLPMLIKTLGQNLTISLVQAIVVSLISSIVGQQTAKLVVKEIVKRNPILNSLGPVVWALSTVWLAFDLQGPAYRKTVPICLYLGIVALRDGPTKDSNFFEM